MRKFALLLLVVFGLGLVACEDDPPPTQVYIVLSPTPGPETVTPGAVTQNSPVDGPEGPVATETTVFGPAANTLTVVPSPTEPPTATPTVAPTTVVPTVAPTATFTETPLPSIFPTNTITQVQLAEQGFEHGHMFWIRHNLQIWVMLASKEDPNQGEWRCYVDTFVDGEMEIDPNIIPPEGLIQPRRGFGKLWRTYPDIREWVGWATTPEFELTSNYTYIAGGYVQDGQYVRGPGEHRMTSISGELISFFEQGIRGDCVGGTWRLAS